MGNGVGNDGWKNWNNLSPGQLKREIEEAFLNAAPGAHPALEVRVENPITEYRVISPVS
jgi:hypothetical protein